MNRAIFAFVFVFGMIFTAAYMLMQQAIRPAPVPTPAPKVEVAQNDGAAAKDEKGEPTKAILIGDLKPKDDESKSSGPAGDDPSSKQVQKDPNKPAASPKPGPRSERTSNQRNQKLKQFVSNTPARTPKPRETNGGIWDEDLDRLQGTWRMVDAEYDGERNPNEAKNYSWEFRVDQYTINCKGHFEENWVVEVNSSRHPKTIDGTGTETKIAPITNPKKLMGIYEVTDDSLRVCYDLTGNSRPDKFQAAKGSRWVVYFFKR
jgi:uncharacterized protein (TIGR03067 family)